MYIHCCKDCKERHLACHDTCSKYKEMKQEHELIKKAKSVIADQEDYFSNSVHNMQTRRCKKFEY